MGNTLFSHSRNYLFARGERTNAVSEGYSKKSHKTFEK